MSAFSLLLISLFIVIFAYPQTHCSCVGILFLKMFAVIKIGLVMGCHGRLLAIQVRLHSFLKIAVQLTMIESVGYKYILSKWIKSFFTK